MRLSLLLVWAVVALVMLWPLLRHLASAKGAPPARRQTLDELVKDPVCQTYVVRSRALSRIVNGVPWHFCSEQCARQFTGLS